MLSFLPLLAWYAIIFWLSDQPRLPGPEEYAVRFIWFKLGHIIFYAILTFFSWFAWKNTLKKSKKRKWIPVASFMTVVALALLDEWHQSLVPGRTPHARDIIIDSIASAVVIWQLSRYNQARKPQKSGM